ncbi:recombinase RecA [Acinetobacter baumannii]|uniref:recombinase RecA n=1 Tax=Acinetobacter baumannii TaxID=470 RepID=UPI00224F8ED2|nr:recombinase RecA [Acinetobacter baumannii]
METKNITSNGKDKALLEAISQIEKQYGKNAIMKMGQKEVAKVNVVSTGSINIDIATGIGGYPCGRIVEIYGPESSGKTTLTLASIAQCQAQGGICAFVDAEHALDPNYAKKLGVDTDNLLVSQPDNGEQALEIVDMLVRSGAIDMLVVDSVAALTPKAEIEGEMGDSHMGLQARLMSQALRKITGNAKRTDTLVIFINQLRQKIGGYGNNETTTGGNALKFYASMRLDIRRIGQVKEGDSILGSETKVKVIKNKMAPPFKEALFQIMYGLGINNFGEVLDAAVGVEALQKNGAWYSYQGNKIAQGKTSACKYLEENTQIYNELKKQVLSKSLNFVDEVEVL